MQVLVKYVNNGIPEFISQLWFFPGKRTPGVAVKGTEKKKKKQRAGFLEQEEALAAEEAEAAESSDDEAAPSPSKRAKK